MRCSMLVFLSSSVIASSLLHAQPARNEPTRAVELSLSDEAGEVRYRAPTSIGGQPNTEAQYAVFLSEDRDIVGSAAVLFDTDLDFGPVQLRLGPQAYAALLDEENEDVFALAVSASLRFDILKSRGIAIVGSANWSPDILTFGSADNLTDFMARAEMRLSDRVTGFAGYRWFRLDLTMRERNTLQNELFAGIHYQLP
jgi:YfaZ precursor